MSSLLFEVVDSFEKLEIVVYLYRSRSSAQRSEWIGTDLSLPAKTVAEALASLLHAGVVRTHQQDGAGWWFDPWSAWATSIEVLVALYELDRDELLMLMKQVAYENMHVSYCRRTPELPS